MPIKAKFHLKNLNAKKTLIYLVYNYHGNRLKMSTGQSINKNNWNKRTQRARENMEIPELEEINTELQLYEDALRAVFKDFQTERVIPEPNLLKERIYKAVKNPAFINPNTPTFWDYFNQFVEYKRNRMKNRGVIDYDKALRKHLNKCEKTFGITLTFNALKNQENSFIDHFDNYLTYEAINSKGEKGLSVNAIGKQYKNIKSFLHWCFNKEICQPFGLKHMPTKSEEADKIYLTEDEIQKVCELEIEDNFLRECRDAFIIGCETGLRFSDFSKINPNHILNEDIKIRQQKTLIKVIIPISPKVRNILNRYGNKSPKIPAQVADFNKAVRLVCQMAGILTPIVIQREIANTTKEEVKLKYELVSSHTCRRSFCTNKYLRGMPVQSIMKISGHKTERAFMRYLRLDAEHVAETCREYFV